MDYWDKRNKHKQQWEDAEHKPRRSRKRQDEYYYDDEEDFPPRASKSKSSKSRQFSTSFLSKTQKQTIAAVCLFFVVLAAKYNNDFTSGAIYGAVQTALAKDNDYTIALTEMAKGVFGGGDGQVVTVNQTGESMELPLQGSIVAKFGKKGPQDKAPNQGIDISAPLGSNVLAPANGIVVKTGTDSVLGRYIKIEHGSGLVSTLSNLAEVHVKTNQKLQKGDVIGTLGFTAALKRPWLHWEVSNGSQNINPESLLAKSPGKV